MCISGLPPTLSTEHILYGFRIGGQKTPQFTMEFNRVQCWGHSCLSFIFYLLAISFGTSASTFTGMLMTLSFMPTSTLPSNTLTACLHDLQVWMTNNYLKFNSSKTELLLIGKPHSQKLMPAQSPLLTSPYLSPHRLKAHSPSPQLQFSHSIQLSIPLFFCLIFGPFPFSFAEYFSEDVCFPLNSANLIFKGIPVRD